MPRYLNNPLVYPLCSSWCTRVLRTWYLVLTIYFHTYSLLSTLYSFDSLLLTLAGPFSIRHYIAVDHSRYAMGHQYFRSTFYRSITFAVLITTAFRIFIIFFFCDSVLWKLNSNYANSKPLSFLFQNVIRVQLDK